MKRKYSEITKELVIKPVEYLVCEICGNKVINYHLRTKPHVYCSLDSYSVLMLSKKNGYLDEKATVPRIKSQDDLMELEDNKSSSSNNSWWSVDHPEECAEMFHSAKEMINDMKGE